MFHKIHTVFIGKILNSKQNILEQDAATDMIFNRLKDSLGVTSWKMAE